MSTSSGMNKLAAERNQRLLMELVAKPGNDICADCKARNPRWASFNLGIFICVSCASIHRKIGTHISKVKSLTLDSWSKEQVDKMKQTGNVKSNAFYNPNEARNPPPPRLDDPARDNDLEQYIRSKYEYKRFLDKKTLVAAKLGPSRSASSVISRTNSLNTDLPSKPAPTPPEPKTATDIAATMFSTAKPQLQPRTTLSQATQQPAQATVKSPPLRSASQPPLSQNNVQSGVKKDGVWADLISLQGPSANASLPLQYQANGPPYGGMASSSTVPVNLSGLGSNPFGSASGVPTSSSLAAFPQRNPSTNPFAQQQLLSQAPLSPFPSSISAPPFQATASQMSSGFNPSNSSLFQGQGQLQAPPVPFYQPQPSSLTPSQTHPQFPSSSPNVQFSPSPQFLSPSPNTQLLTSNSPQMLSTTPISTQQTSVSQSGFNSSNVPGYLTPSPQPMISGMHGQTQVPMFGTGTVQPPQATHAFGQVQYGQGGFPGQNGPRWGPL